MDDYSIMIKNLPPQETYGGDRDVLKAQLWNHFYNLFEEEIKAEQEAEQDDEGKPQDQMNEGGDI